LRGYEQHILDEVVFILFLSYTSVHT